MKTKIVLSLISFIVISGILWGCKKKIGNSSIQTDTLMKVYVKDSDEENFYIQLAPDGGFVLINSTDYLRSKDKDGLQVIKTDGSGNEEWSYLLKDSLKDPLITGLKDGSIAISSGSEKGWLIHLDSYGQLLSKRLYLTGFPSGIYSFPIQKPDGGFTTAYSNGWSTGSASLNTLYNFDVDGIFLNEFTINDSEFGGKMASLDLYNYEDPGIYYFYGIIFKYPFTSWSNNPNLFVSRIQISGNNIISKQTSFLDLKNIENTNWPFYKSRTLLRSLALSDGGIVISSIQSQKQINYIGHLVKADKNLNKLWEMDLIIGNGNTVPKSITLAEDGNYLVCGLCYDMGKLKDQPFACKVSKDGKILWSKIYNMPKSGSMNYGFEKNGKLYFGGTTNSFGNGKNSDDVFFMKTDINGNVN